LSIVRRPSSSVSVIQIAPGSGTTGTSVTIYGTGFSPVPAQNTVTFNGTVAAVTSATATQIVATIPSGATTGPVAVTAPAGSATSAGDFIVTAAGQAPPTIAGFTPVLAAAGTPITITGTDFAPGAPGSTLRFNTSLSSASTGSSSTTLLASVPLGATSGRIRVSNGAGEAQSADDLFVPPPPIAVTDVVFTGRMSVGGSLAVPIPTANKVGLVVFDAGVGQRLNLKLQPGPAVAALIRRPGGTTFAHVSAPGVPGFTDVIVAPTTGTYTILVDPSGTGTGTTTLTLYGVPPDVTGSIPLTGANTGVTITTPGQNARLTFTAGPSQRVSLKAGGGPTGALRITGPNGAAMGTGSVAITPTFIEPVSITTAGLHAVEVDPSGGNVGSVTLNLYDVPPDIVGSIAPGGSPVALALTTPGQNGQLSFTGSSGQRISLRISASSPTGSVTILNPDQSVFKTASMGSLAQFVDASTLPQSGTFAIDVNPTSFNAGTVTLTLYDVPPDVSGTLTINASPTPVSLGTPGQNAQLTFAGSSGQAVTVRVAGNSMGLVTIKLLRPDGSQLTSATSLAGTFNLAQQTLSTTGTYTVVVDPSAANTGSLNLQVTNP
jgi:hypothetical protein